MAARAGSILNHISTSKEDEVKVYNPVKRFDHAKVQANEFFANFTHETKTVPQTSVSKPRSIHKPDPEVVKACYAKIGPSNNGRLIGKAPLKVGAVPTKITRPAPATVMGSALIGKGYRRSLASSAIVSGGWVGAKKQFVRFTEGEFRINTKFDRRIKDIAGLSERISLKKPLATPRKMHIHYMPFRGGSLPGGDLSNSYRVKSQAWATACMAANKLWSATACAPTPNMSIYTCGGREKVSVGKESGEWLQSRLVLQQDQTEFALAKPYVRNVEQYMFNDYLSPITIGRPSTGNRVFTLLGKLSWYKHGMEFDWSGYDSTVSAEFIVAAFAFVRSLFEESEEIDNHFVYFCHGFLEKCVVAPDGNTFLLRRGVPSGSCWTTIINSVVNALLLEDMGSRYLPFKNKTFDYIVAGDDGVMLWTEKVDFNPRKLEEWVKRRVDMDLDIIRVGPPINDNPNKSLTFNKKCYYWSNGRAVPTVQPKLLAKRLFPIAWETQSFANISNTLSAQVYDHLAHPDCRYILQYANGCSLVSIGLPADSDIALTAGMVHDALYVLPAQLAILENDVYSADKVHPLRDKTIWDETPDMNVVANWLRDNSLRLGGKISRAVRLKWLTDKMGKPSSVPALWRLMQSEAIDPVKFGVPQRDIDWIWKIWQRWYSVTPDKYNFSG